MSSYFDDFEKRTGACKTYRTANLIEEEMVAQVVAVMEGRGIPDNLRERWADIRRRWFCSAAAAAFFNTCKLSRLVAETHRLFHDVAASGLRDTEFGLLTDNPTEMLRARDAQIAEQRSVARANAEKGTVEMLPLLLVLFLTLKLTGLIAWSWWWVLSPLWMPVAIAVQTVFWRWVLASTRRAQAARAQRVLDKLYLDSEEGASKP